MIQSYFQLELTQMSHVLRNVANKVGKYWKCGMREALGAIGSGDWSNAPRASRKVGLRRVTRHVTGEATNQPHEMLPLPLPARSPCPSSMPKPRSRRRNEGLESGVVTHRRASLIWSDPENATIFTPSGTARRHYLTNFHESLLR